MWNEHQLASLLKEHHYMYEINTSFRQVPQLTITHSGCATLENIPVHLICKIWQIKRCSLALNIINHCLHSRQNYISITRWMDPSMTQISMLRCYSSNCILMWYYHKWIIFLLHTSKTENVGWATTPGVLLNTQKYQWRECYFYHTTVKMAYHKTL